MSIHITFPKRFRNTDTCKQKELSVHCKNWVVCKKLKKRGRTTMKTRRQLSTK